MYLYIFLDISITDEDESGSYFLIIIDLFSP